MLTVKGFDNRGTREYPFGFIVFSDETRMTYAALLGPDNSRGDRDEWGLASDVEDHGLSEYHVRLARKYVEKHLRLPKDAVPEYEAKKAADPTSVLA